MPEYKYNLATSKEFLKNYEMLVKRNYKMKLLDDVIEMLLRGETLPAEYKDHPLKGNWQGYRECHIQFDWLLIYQIRENTLVLMLSRTGTHSDLRF